MYPIVNKATMNSEDKGDRSEGESFSLRGNFPSLPLETQVSQKKTAFRLHIPHPKEHDLFHFPQSVFQKLMKFVASDTDIAHF